MCVCVCGVRECLFGARSHDGLRVYCELLHLQYHTREALKEGEGAELLQVCMLNNAVGLCLNTHATHATHATRAKQPK